MRRGFLPSSMRTESTSSTIAKLNGSGLHEAPSKSQTIANSWKASWGELPALNILGVDMRKSTSAWRDPPFSHRCDPANSQTQVPASKQPRVENPLGLWDHGPQILIHPSFVLRSKRFWQLIWLIQKFMQTVNDHDPEPDREVRHFLTVIESAYRIVGVGDVTGVGCLPFRLPHTWLQMGSTIFHIIGVRILFQLWKKICPSFTIS